MFRRRKREPPSPGGQMPVLEHLGELRRRVFVCVIAIGIGAVIAFAFSNQIIKFLVEYYTDATRGQTELPRKALVFTGPADAFLTRLKVATYGGVILALPVWLYELWRFITPGLNPKEKRYAIPFIISALVLFALGAFVAFQTLEPALKFLVSVGGEAQEPLFTSDKYLGLVLLMIIAFGLAFEFPVVLVFLLIAHVITTDQLRKARRWAIVAIVTFAAVITPSQDPYSLAFMAVPMYIFYESAILIGRIIKR